MILTITKTVPDSDFGDLLMQLHQDDPTALLDGAEWSVYSGPIQIINTPTDEHINSLICALGETFLDYEHRAAVREWVAALATPTP